MMKPIVILCVLYGLAAASSRYDDDSRYDDSRYDKSRYDHDSRYDKSRYGHDSVHDKSRYDKSRYDDDSRYDKSRYDKSKYDKSRYEYQPRYDPKPSYDRYEHESRYDKSRYDKSKYDKSSYDKDSKYGKKPKHEQFYYVGLYRGSCGKDGLYYSNPFSFIVCTSGNHYVQPCSPGTRNRPLRNYEAGKHYGYTDFCSINLNDLGYSVNVNAGLHGYYPVKPLPPPRPYYPY